MHAALLSIVVAATPSTADEGSAAKPPPPAPPSAADTVVAAAFTKDIDTKATALQPGPGAGTLVAPLLAIASLAGVAFALTR
ncbi:MAG: hypothetical protein INH37_03540, partial [Myxococcaceae bacterium]|nr:hypothetical protein [Myxococcaceae bacterium]